MYDNIFCLDVLHNLPIAVIVVDKNFEIKSMNLSSINLIKTLGIEKSNYEKDIHFISENLCFYNELRAFIEDSAEQLKLLKKVNYPKEDLYFKIHFTRINSLFYEDEIITITLEDISEIKNLECSLINREEQLNSILDNIPVMMSVFDKDKNIILWNKECENITGYKKEELKNMDTIIKLFYPNVSYRDYIVKKVLELGPCIKDLESDIQCKDGNIKTISWYTTGNNLNLSNWSSIRFGLDITKRKFFEKCLLEKTSEFELIFKALPDLYLRLDKDGTFLDFKAPDEKDLFLPPEKFLGHKIEEVFKDEIGLKFKSALIQALKTKDVVFVEYELTIGKELRYFEARFLPIANEEIITIVRNITKRKQTEEELLKIEKLNSLGTLAGGVAHDFNNILTIVLGNISMLKITSNTEGKILNKLIDIEKVVLQAKGLTKQLLTFAKGNNPIKKITYINDVIKETVDLALSGTNAICNLCICNNLSPVEIDIGQISQVINNLVINACQSMPNGGTINIDGRNINLSDNEIIGLKAGKYVKISIKDQGHGISKSNLLKIFDPYFSTKPTGNGLGLTSAYIILQKHNGHIMAKSKVGKGTIFQIFLPACNSIPIEIEEPKLLLTKGNTKILVMDDELDIRQILKSMLEHLGYNVSLSKDGLEAIKLYEQALQSGNPFDAVIMDLTIPGGMGGEETIKHLLEIDPKIKAIVSSGYHSGGVMGNYKSHGFKAVINKPYTIEELSTALNNLFGSC